MPRKMPRVNPTQLRKELLIAESELNRAQLLEEWQPMIETVRIFRGRLKSVSELASTVALLVAAVSAFRRERAAAKRAKSSWLDLVLKGARVAVSLWPVLRPSDHDRSK